jgi:Protein of unknown function (DUF4232)
MTKRGYIPVGLTIVGLCVVFTTACSSMAGGASAPSSGPGSGVRNPSTASPTAPTSAPAPPSSAAASSTGTCSAEQLTVKADGYGVAGGQAELMLEITNNGTAACTLSGYPAVVGRLPSGGVVRGTDTENVMLGVRGPVGSPSPVVIASGAHAWVPLNFGDTPLNGAKTCPSFSSFTFTPPGVDRAYPIRASGVDCAGFRVPPVLPADDVVIPSGG